MSVAQWASLCPVSRARIPNGHHLSRLRCERRSLHYHFLSSPRPTRPCLRRQAYNKSTQRNQSSGPVEAVAATGLGIARYIYGAGLLVVAGFGYLYITDTRAGVHQYVVPRLLRTFVPDAETAHHAGVNALKALYTFGLYPRERSNQDQERGDLQIEVFGHVLDNPVGTSAGIDKDGEISSALLALGPAVVEVGGVTPRPQEGNPQPRVFRIPSQNALINRYGLNSEGADHVAMQLRERVRDYAYRQGFGIDQEAEQMVLDGGAGVPPGSLVPGKLLLVQVAKNKTTPDNDINAIAQDYVYGVYRMGKYADVIVVNVSSPNTPGLRDLQATAPLTAILTAVVGAAKSVDRKTKPAVMVKVSPDEDSDEQIEGICTAVWSSGVDGVIVGNTTKKRPDPTPRGFILPAEDVKVLEEIGGYSGPQMFERTLNLVKRYRIKLDHGPSEEVQSKEPEKKSKPASADPIEASVERDAARLKSSTDSDKKEGTQPLIRLPERHSNNDVDESESNQADAASPLVESKVIFATGGITNGEQCLQILNAGASVCQVYTAMMYGGVGTPTRIKREMREALQKPR